MTELRLLSVLLVTLLGLTGCTEAAKARLEANHERAQKKMAEKALEERALEYWGFARWYTWEETARFYELSDDQLEHLRSGVDRSPDTLPKRDAIQLQFVYVDPEHRKTGEVRVKWNEFVPAEGHVVEESSTQRWYKRGGQWWLAPEAGIPHDEYDDLGDAPEVEEIPELDTVVPEATAAER